MTGSSGNSISRSNMMNFGYVAVNFLNVRMIVEMAMALLTSTNSNCFSSERSWPTKAAVPGQQSSFHAIWRSASGLRWPADRIQFLPGYVSRTLRLVAASCSSSLDDSLMACEERPVNVMPTMAPRIQIRLQPASYRGRPVEDEDVAPDHLLVLVHGILASPSDWKYVEAELRPQLGSRYLLFASAANSYLNTFNGIDTAGKRLAEEVGFVVKRTPSLKKISFLGHSLGGLFARYAIAMLYSPSSSASHTENQVLVEELERRGEKPHFQDSRSGTIAGLEPVDFITLATPHLGVRGRQQLPFLLGLPVLEKLAAPLAPFFVGSTGRQLFLTDGKASEPPLLLRMATDCEEGPFISALRAFKLRITYANVSYDHMVGWRTSSIRRESELSKPPRRSLQGYKHVVSVMDSPPVESSNPQFEEGTAKAKEAVQSSPTSSKKAATYHEILEEEMIKGLQQVGWRKVDVSFHAALWPFLAHNYIHVKQEWLHYEGAGVIRHVVDTLVNKEVKPLLHSKL